MQQVRKSTKRLQLRQIFGSWLDRLFLESRKDFWNFCCLTAVKELAASVSWVWFLESFWGCSLWWHTRLHAFALKLRYRSDTMKGIQIIYRDKALEQNTEQCWENHQVSVSDHYTKSPKKWIYKWEYSIKPVFYKIWKRIHGKDGINLS